MPKFIRRPMIVEAIRWTGDNEEELIEFCDKNFYRLSEEDAKWADNPEATATVMTSEHGFWQHVLTGYWIVKHGRDISLMSNENFKNDFDAASTFQYNGATVTLNPTNTLTGGTTGGSSTVITRPAGMDHFKGDLA